jgi:Rrf2 family transcriptional regulator, iron-sulfur cluster assembly transcription factor
MFSASCHYGIQAMMCIAKNHSANDNIELSKIAAEYDIPKHFLSKILQQLVKGKLLNSTKGPSGGYKLTRHPDEITLIEIVEIIDGTDVFYECGIGFKKCDDEDPCPFHDDYKAVRDKVKHLFETKTLGELSKDPETSDTFLRIL